MPNTAAREVHTATALLLYTAVLLLAMEYWCLPPRVESLLQGLRPELWTLPPSLRAGLWWTSACVVGYAVLPMAGAAWFGFPPRANGTGVVGLGRHLRVYLAFYACLLPAIVWASCQPDFTAIYPFVPEARDSWRAFLGWELAYVAQFFALESFFRGTLLFGLARVMGSWPAVAAMTVPYALIHIHKPAHEAFGAIVAGVILGSLALRYRSWLGGAVLHSLVAVTMDTLASGRELGLWR